MLNEYNENKTAQQIAKEWILSAIDGRMQELITDDIELRLPEATQSEKQQLERHLRNYLVRTRKFIELIK